MSETLQSVIPGDCAGLRVDQALAQMFPDYSRSRLSGWLKQGRIEVAGRCPKPREIVAGGEAVTLELPPPEPSGVAAEPIALDIVYQDDSVLVINKPAGLVVHPGAGNPDGTLQNALLHHAPELDAVPRAGIVHRLDKETSGLMVVARTLAAHTRLVEAIQARAVKREYDAVAVGVMTGGGRVEAAIGRHSQDRVRMAVREGGRHAVTHYRVVRRFRGHTQVRVRLETGRTHQIRVHLAHIGYPLVGDPVYGRRLRVPKGASPELEEALRGFRRQALHARRLGLEHPASGEFMEWQAPLPADMQTLLDTLTADAAELPDAAT